MFIAVLAHRVIELTPDVLQKQSPIVVLYYNGNASQQNVSYLRKQADAQLQTIFGQLDCLQHSSYCTANNISSPCFAVRWEAGSHYSPANLPGAQITAFIKAALQPTVASADNTTHLHALFANAPIYYSVSGPHPARQYEPMFFGLGVRAAHVTAEDETVKCFKTGEVAQEKGPLTARIVQRFVSKTNFTRFQRRATLQQLEIAAKNGRVLVQAVSEGFRGREAEEEMKKTASKCPLADVAFATVAVGSEAANGYGLQTEGEIIEITKKEHIVSGIDQWIVRNTPVKEAPKELTREEKEKFRKMFKREL